MSICLNNKKIRSTREAEIQRNVFQDDFSVYSRMKGSTDLRRYCELEGYVNNIDFRERRKKIEHLIYRESESYQLEKKYKSLLKSPQLRAYYLVDKSAELKNYLKIKQSKIYIRYAELRDRVSRGNLTRRSCPQEYAEYKELEKREVLKEAITLEGKRKFVYYLKIKDSGLPDEFEKLKTYIESEKFRQEKRFLLDRNRYKSTEDYKLWCEYELLKNRPDIIRYFLLSTDECFQNMCQWNVVFEDNFTRKEWDRKKWSVSEKGIQNISVKEFDNGNKIQLYTEKNLEFTDNSVVLNFRNEAVGGYYRNEKGKISKNKYTCTAARLSSASSFCQCYGKFEAKIKLTNFSVEQCFELRSESDLSRIKIMKGCKKGIYMGNVPASGKGKKNTLQLLSGLKYTEDFYIFSLEWTPEKMVWKINDAVVKEVVKDIPAVPMYIVFSIGSDERQSIDDTTAQMEIAWIKCYEMKRKNREVENLK